MFQATKVLRYDKDNTREKWNFAPTKSVACSHFVNGRPELEGGILSSNGSAETKVVSGL